MNILPKKRWHVRTKDNIARVRRDEAEALEKQKQKEERIKLAEKEARIDLLRKKSRQNYTNQNDFIQLDDNNGVASCSGYVDIFQDLKEGLDNTKKTNKEHDKELKIEKEKYEKQIGYLTYLGQDTNEALGKQNWYELPPERSNNNEEVSLKTKIREDPLEIMKKYVKSYDKSKNNSSINSNNLNNIVDEINIIKRKKYKSKKKKKKHKSRKGTTHSSSSSSNDDDDHHHHHQDKDDFKEIKRKKLEQLRMERLKREKVEQLKTEQLLSKLKGEKTKQDETFIIKRKYNSQFNPELAKQNFLDNR